MLKLKNYFAQRHNKIPAQMSNEIPALLEKLYLFRDRQNDREQGKETKKILKFKFEFRAEFSKLWSPKIGHTVSTAFFLLLRAD